MSSDRVKNLEMLRSFYRASNTTSQSEEVRELKNIKTEIQILNDESATKAYPLTNAVGSPYLQDQAFFNKDILYNSEKESEWKVVKSYDELYNNLSTSNLKKLNIL